MEVVVQDLKWAAVIAGLRALGLDDERIAREAGTPLSEVTKMAKGLALPEPMARMRLRRMEVHYRRVGSVAPPKIEGPDRGVYEQPAKMPGYRTWESITSAGILGVRIMVHESMLGSRDIGAGLEKWLNEEDAILRVIDGGQTS